MRKQKTSFSGFVLPSILITSVILMFLLLVSIQALMSIRSAMNDQYYQTVARTAAESGLSAASRCIKKSELWTVPLEPNATDCTGTAKTPTTCPETTRDKRCGVIDSPMMRSTYAVSVPVMRDNGLYAEATGTVKLYRQGGASTYKTYNFSLKKTTHQAHDRTATRATERFWYFGNRAGLDFGTSGVAVTAFRNTSPACDVWCIASEGSTVVTDTGGNLIFWTNGQTVWDKAGNVLDNSTGLNADSSAAQAATSFPLNKAGTKYAIVTNTTDNGKNSSSYTGSGELYYSLIDMTMRGGLGSVTTKNVPIYGSMKKYASEASAAAPKADGKGYWVLTYNPNTGNILVFDFDENGLVSTVPKEYPSGNTLGVRSSNLIGYGTLNFNNQFNRLVMMSGAHCLSGGAACTSKSGYIRTMRFNAVDGSITNEYAFDVGKVDTTHASPTSDGYSADFSHGGKYVYATVLYPSRLYRYTLDGNTTSQAVKSSEKFVAISGTSSTDPAVRNGGGQVKRGPNGKMYVANHVSGAISVIQNPDAAPIAGQTVAQAVGWQHNGQPLAPNSLSTYGLPQMVTSYSPFMVTY